MTLALLLLTLANPGAPLRPDLYETHLSAPAGVLLPAVASRGGQIYSGVSNTVAGSILLVIGGAIGAGGLYSLIGAANEPDPKAKTVFTVLGWTFFGFGAVLAVVGIPLLIVGIVQLSNRPGRVSLTVGQGGNLAVAF